MSRKRLISGMARRLLSMGRRSARRLRLLSERVAQALASGQGARLAAMDLTEPFTCEGVAFRTCCFEPVPLNVGVLFRPF